MEKDGLVEIALLVSRILESSRRCFGNGMPAPPECVDHPEGRIQLRLSDTLANRLSHLLIMAVKEYGGGTNDNRR